MNQNGHNTILLYYRDTLIGLRGPDFVLLMCDRSAARSIIAYKHDEDKMLPLDDYKLLAQAGMLMQFNVYKTVLLSYC